MKILTDILREKFKISKLTEIQRVVMDSRMIERGDLFFAINNGNNYIDEVLEKGAFLVVADNYSGCDERVVVVEDSIRTMQELAHEYRTTLNVQVIGITGSNGKTTTKDMIYSVLSQKFKCRKTEGNYNNHIGLPYTILQLQDNDEILVLEMGMSGFGEIDRLCEIAKPDYGVITNIGASHLEFLKTVENVFKAKSELLKYVKKEDVLLFGEDRFLCDVEGIHIGYSDSNDYVITNFVDREEGATFSLNNIKYEITMNGKHNCINASMGIVMGKIFGLTEDEIQAGLRSLKGTPMRFEKVIRGEILYINDAYNASSVVAVNYSLETFDALYNQERKIVVLGDMLEMGEKEIDFHQEVIEKALSIRCDKILLLGKRMERALERIGVNKKIELCKDKNEIVEKIDNFIGRKVVFIKGSRGMKMEEIIRG